MENKALINYLNQLLSNYFVMYVKLHRYHWYITGKHFFQLHEKFEEMYTMFGDDLDEIAERILTINGAPFATMEKFIKQTSLVEASADDQADEMISQLIADYEEIINSIKREGIRLAEVQGDEPTIDLLISLQSKLEKYNWMLAAYKENK